MAFVSVERQKNRGFCEGGDVWTVGQDTGQIPAPARHQLATAVPVAKQLVETNSAAAAKRSFGGVRSNGPGEGEGALV